MATYALIALLGVLGGSAAGGLVAYVIFTSLARGWERDNPSNLSIQTRVDELQGHVEALAATWRKETMRRVRSAATGAPEAPTIQPAPFDKERLRREMGQRIMQGRQK